MPSFTNLAALGCVFVACTAAAGCQQSHQPGNQAAVQNSAATPVENVAAQVLTPQPAMDRPALLEAVASARSAAAAGLDDSHAQQQLDGREFEFRIRFGCAGPDGARAPTLGWSLDAKGGVLRVHAASDIAKDDPVVAAMDLQSVEAVEGLWIDRPWLLQATCPAMPPSVPAPAVQVEAVRGDVRPKPGAGTQAARAEPQPIPAAPKVGIAQFFTASDPRTARRGDRPYEAVKKVDGSTTVGQQGFDLVLSGRLRALDEGRVIRCLASNPDAPPACIVSASFDHVWIEDAASKERIADWSSS